MTANVVDGKRRIEEEMGLMQGQGAAEDNEVC
jgi:hypothetical protein